METNVVSVSIPSVIGIGETDLGALSLGLFSKKNGQRVPHKVRWNNVTYLVGDKVENYTHSQEIERMDLQRLADSCESRVLSYAAMGLALGGGNHEVSVVIGLPVEVMTNGDLAKKLLKELEHWFVGDHEFVFDGMSHSITVKNLRAMAQPAGSYFAWGLDETGRWNRSKDDLRAPVAIADIGFNTVDVLSVQSGEVIGRFTAGESLGMRRAANLLCRSLKEVHQLSISLHSADSLLKGTKPALYVASEKVDLTNEVNQALDATASSVLSFLESRLSNGRQFGHLIFTGGGATMLKERLLMQFPHGFILHDPVQANASGLAKYARRLYGRNELVLGLDPGFGSYKVCALNAINS